VAQRVRISKRTFYHRFADKSALFAAVVHRIVQQLRPPADVPLLKGVDLQAMLEQLAGLILHAAISPQAIALHRLIVAESARFPDLAEAVAREGAAEEAIKLIAGLIEREAAAGRLKLDDPVFAAQQFLQMVVGVPQRRAMGLGKPMTTRELAAWPRDITDLFLHGCRGEPRKR
jgi:TetR/AcrR family transcriptional regulator, mexJK operon transcriptional repressor